MAAAGIQLHWAYCSKCAGLFFAPNEAKSVCPAGGKHVITASYDYAIDYDNSAPAVSLTEKMLAVMLSKVGDGYTEQIPQRFGVETPQRFDCSGLVWYAANHAGIWMPGGPLNDVAALAPTELVWAAKQPGAVAVFEQKLVQAGDLLGFIGGDPAPYNITIGGRSFRGPGHIGMAISPSQYVSAYDTAQGVRVKPISGDVFQVAVRMGV